MSIHPVILNELESVGWIKRSETSYTPTKHGKNLAQKLLASGKYSERMIAQVIDPSITPLNDDEEREMIYQEMVQSAHERLLEEVTKEAANESRKVWLWSF